jgi:aryl-alcohol dehydrogenase-like predicted oxidoreductase
MIKSRKLGTNGPVVSAVGLGCMGMSDFYGPSDNATSEAVLKEAVELGVTFFDTADMYGVGANESLLGFALRSVRNQITIATKFGNMRGLDGSHLGVNGRPEYVKAACDQSLKRLGVDHIDLYYQHRVDPAVPIEDTVGAMADLVTAGKVRWLGLSEAGASTIRRAHKVHPISALQTELSLWSRDAQGEIMETLRELGIGFVAYSPLGRGFLTGAITKPTDFSKGDFRAANPRMSGSNFDTNLQLVEAVEAMASDKGVTAAQLALAWVLAQGNDVVPIPGTRHLKYLQDNIAAAEISLTDAELAQLTSIVPPDAVAGMRYDETGMKRLGL